MHAYVFTRFMNDIYFMKCSLSLIHLNVLLWRCGAMRYCNPPPYRWEIVHHNKHTEAFKTDGSSWHSIKPRDKPWCLISYCLVLEYNYCTNLNTVCFNVAVVLLRIKENHYTDFIIIQVASLGFWKAWVWSSDATVHCFHKSLICLNANCQSTHI